LHGAKWVIFPPVLFLIKGLDYHGDVNPEIKKKQNEVFERQLNMAVSLNKPMVIHARDADADTFAIMTNIIKNKIHPIHVHCFTSSGAFAKKLVSHFDNLFIGVTGIVTFNNAHIVHDMVKNVITTKKVI
jgi:TatD DNase family protein